MDPKLSGVNPNVQPQNNNPVGPQIPQQPFQQSPTQPQPIQNQQPFMNAQQPAAPQAMNQNPGIAFNTNNPVMGQTTAVKKGGSKATSLIVGLVILVLLIAYTFVWIYVFKLQVPFLPQF